MEQGKNMWSLSREARLNSACVKDAGDLDMLLSGKSALVGKGKGGEEGGETVDGI